MKRFAKLKDKNGSEVFRGSHGGELLKTRRGRQGSRPLSTRATMHLVLKSSKAKGAWSFHKKNNKKIVRTISEKFSKKYGIHIISITYLGSYLQFQIKLKKKSDYYPFIRALTSAVAMAVSGASRWNPLKKKPSDRFWDHRPFSQIVKSFKSILGLRQLIHYVRNESLYTKNIHQGYLYREKLRPIDSS